MSTSSVPVLFSGLVDDAAVFPPGNAPLDRAVADHRRHRAAWYADMVGPLVIPASAAPELVEIVDRSHPPVVALIADTGLDRIAEARQCLADAGITVSQIEAAVAKRGEDPLPGLGRFLDVGRSSDELGRADDEVGRSSDEVVRADDEVGRAEKGGGLYAEIPLTWGVLDALDAIAEARRDRAIPVAAKFRTGGLAAELFPSPGDLAGVIAACHERGVPYKLTAGLHRAVRHTEPDTGFTHHGFLNVLAADLAARDGAPIAGITAVLATTDPVPLIEAVRAARATKRPLWTGFGSCDMGEPRGDLQSFGLLGADPV